MEKMEGKGANPNRKPEKTEEMVVVVTENAEKEVSDQIPRVSVDAAIIATPRAQDVSRKTAEEEGEIPAIIATSAAEADKSGKISAVNVNGKQKVEKTQTSDEAIKEAAVTGADTTPESPKKDSEGAR